MVEEILLQISPSAREALQVHAAYHHDRVMYVEHVLLHSLVLPLLDLIQSPYHGIIVTLVTECLLHVHQQVPHGDILALIQHVGPFAGVPTDTGKDVGVHAGLIILLEEGIHIEVPERVHHLGPWISQLKDRHIQPRGCQPFLLPTPSVAPAPMPVACSLTRSGVSIRVQCPSVQGGGGQTPSANCSALGLWWPSVQLRCTCMGGEPSLGHLFHPRGSSDLLWEVRPPCSYNWNIMDWVLCPTPQPLAVEAATDHHHTSIRGNRLMVKWAEPEIHSEKASSMWVWTACVASCPKP